MQEKLVDMDAGCSAFPTSNIIQSFLHQESCLPNNRTPITDGNCECNHEPYLGGVHSPPYLPSYVYPSHIPGHYQQENGHWQECQPEHLNQSEHWNHPVPWNQPMDTQDGFLAGYMDCAREAIRFLTEDEGLTSSHPTVAGLQSHLMDQSPMAHLRYLLQSGALLGKTDANEGVEDELIPDISETDASNVVRDTRMVQYPSYIGVDEVRITTNNDLKEAFTNTIQDSESHSRDHVDATSIDTNTNTDDSTVDEIHKIGLQYHIETEHIHRTCGESVDCLSSHVQPAHTQDSKQLIAAKLAEEIFQLLHGDISMSDDDVSDDEGESSDEGFDEQF